MKYGLPDEAVLRICITEWEPMKTLAFIFLLFSTSTALAAVANQNALTSFADKNSYKDNRKTIVRDKIFSASKNCCDKGAYSVVEAYPDQDRGFKQVALWCDHCGTNQISAEQISLCQTEFKNLYSEIFSSDADEALVKGLVPPTALGKYTQLSAKNTSPRVRVTSGLLKCDGKRGYRFRADIFSR